MLNEARLQLTDFLNSSIFKNNFMEIDLWSLVHLSTGFILIKKFNLTYKKLFILLFAYEVFEFVCIFYNVQIGTLPLFREESYLNIAFDLIIGMFGGYLAKR